MPMELMQNRIKKIWLPKDEIPEVPINGKMPGCCTLLGGTVLPLSRLIWGRAVRITLWS